jgi:predicted transcriptional regulator
MFMTVNNTTRSTRVATKTLSASLDPAIYRATQRVAKEERRPQSAVVAEALRLYTGLPLETRQAVLALDRQLGEEATASKLGAAVRTATLEARLEAIVRTLPSAGLTDAQIATLASEAVTWSRRRPRD